MELTVIGVFDDATRARQAVERLVSAGVNRTNIDLSAQANTGNDVEYHDDYEDSGVVQFFKELFGDDEHERKTYSKVGSRGTIVTVHASTEDQAEKAADILDDNGALNVRDHADKMGFATTDTRKDFTDTDRSAMGKVEGGENIKIIEENLEIGKKTVQTGGVRLRSRIISKPVEESVRLREERVVVDRKAVDRPATEGELDNFKEGEVTITEQAERAVVGKTAKVVEEVSVGKEVNDREEIVRETVRKTEVDVEQLGTDSAENIVDRLDDDMDDVNRRNKTNPPYRPS